jgi:hypothetical protein
MTARFCQEITKDFPPLAQKNRLRKCKMVLRLHLKAILIGS